MKCAEGADLAGLKALEWLMKRLGHRAGKRCVIKLKRYERLGANERAFLVVRREGAQVTECWCPDEVAKQELVALGWPEEGIWTRDGS